MAVLVKCSVCGKQFDRLKEPFVKTSSTRYAHVKCGKIKEKEDKEKEDKKKLEDYIKQVYGMDRISPLIRKQIDSYIKDDMTYSGMLGSLYYFYGVKGNDSAKAKGIGIIPYIYQEAEEYFRNLSRINLMNKGQDFTIKEKVIVIPVPQSKPKRKKNFFRDFFKGDD